MIGLVLFPAGNEKRNYVAEMEVDQIAAAWFIPDGKTIDELIWLRDMDVRPLYQGFSFQEIDSSPDKWRYAGRVGFTYPNG